MRETLPLNLMVRPAIAEDAPYILTAWTRSYHRDFIGNFFRPWELYLPAERERIADILSRDTTNVLVAVLPEDTSFIVAYLVWEEDSNGKNIIHYVQTKGGYKRRGIAKFLLGKAGIDIREPLFVSSITDICRHFKDANKYQLIQGDFTDQP